jgi:hypothetical protein
MYIKIQKLKPLLRRKQAIGSGGRMNTYGNKVLKYIEKSW